VKGEYAQIFEEEYRRWAKHPDYQSLFKSRPDVRRRGGAQRLLLHRQEEAADKTRPRTTRTPTATTPSDAYNLIMKDKEKLLSFETPLKFIFSHSALREGWDNPNVFQICTCATWAPSASAARPSAAACACA
jgi:type III restriction enzyme